MKAIYKGGIAGAALLASGFFMGEAFAYQEHMHAAMDALNTARSELQQAEHNKRGHRAEALRLTNAAIEETRLGIDEAN
jgi:hypothetical protein